MMRIAGSVVVVDIIVVAIAVAVIHCITNELHAININALKTIVTIILQGGSSSVRFHQFTLLVCFFH